MSLKALFVLVPLVSLALVGCGPTCEGLCDDAQEADCYDNDNEDRGSNFDHAGCYAMCQEQEDMEDDDVDDCVDQWDSLLTCANEQSDICKVWEEDGDAEVDPDTWYVKVNLKKCSSEYNDYHQCVWDYCSEHQKRDYCDEYTFPD